MNMHMQGTCKMYWGLLDKARCNDIGMLHMQGRPDWPSQDTSQHGFFQHPSPSIISFETAQVLRASAMNAKLQALGIKISRACCALSRSSNPWV
jgi:hypothetical protein